MNNTEATTASTFVAVTNRAGKTATYEITAARRELFGGGTAEETAVNIAVQTGHVKRYTNPIAVVRVDA